MPVLPTVATVVFVDDHAPPGVVFERVMVEDVFTVDGPLIDPADTPPSYSNNASAGDRATV